MKILWVSVNVAAETHIAMCDMDISLKQLHSSIERFRTSMYRQKHAFYFRMLKQWSECLSVSDGTIFQFFSLNALPLQVWGEEDSG